MTDNWGLVDSNILIYAYNLVDGEKHEKAVSFISKELLGNTIVFSVQTLSEFSATVTKKIQKPISCENAKQIVLELSKTSAILKHSEKTIVEALNISQAYNLHFWDALIAATMRENSIAVLYTENEKDFKKIEWIETINPIK